nr:hypothetical protein [Tanacetum cinerariifolium]
MEYHLVDKRLTDLMMMVLVRQTEECDMMLHMEKTDMLILVAEIKVGDMTADDVDKLAYSADVVKPRQPIGPTPDLKTADLDIIDKYYESVNLEQESRLNRNCLKQSKHSMLRNKMMVSQEKGKGKGKNILSYAPNAKIPLPPKIDNPKKDFICHHCKEIGHWRRNFPSYHAELKKRKNASVASTSGIFTIKLYAFPNKTWVYDTGCGTHICNTSQGQRESKKLKHGALSPYIGNGMRAAVEAIRSFDLIIPSGLIIVLDNCHFTPIVTRGVVSISHLVNNGYIHTFTNYGISVSKDNVFYFNAIPRDGIYEIDMHNLYPSSDRILQPTHDESHEKCKPCISGNMARKPFPHQVKRAKDLLGLIHTDRYALETAARILNMFQPRRHLRPPMLNKENYVPWSSRLLCYAKSRPNGKLIHNSIINGPYVRRMIPEPGDTNREVRVNETFHVQNDDELAEKELKQIEADDQAIQTILLDLPENIYAAVDSCETAQEIWLRVQQMNERL